MARLFFSIGAIFGPIFAMSQNLEVRNLSRNMRAGFENAVEFSLKVKFDSIEIRATQGRVSADKKFIRIYPETSGRDTIFANFLNKGKIVYLDTLIFDIIKPEVFPSFGGDLVTNRKFKLEYLKARGGITFHIRVNDFHWENPGIQSYRFTIIRMDSCIFSRIEYSAWFSDELKIFLDHLESGDIILISDANIQYSKETNILPGVFVIE
jgi:hypothetical protein